MEQVRTTRGTARSNSMAFVTSQLETLGMIEQPVWLSDSGMATGMFNQCIGEIKKSDSCLETPENSDHSSGNFSATLFNLVEWQNDTLNPMLTGRAWVATQLSTLAHC